MWHVIDVMKYQSIKDYAGYDKKGQIKLLCSHFHFKASKLVSSFIVHAIVNTIVIVASTFIILLFICAFCRIEYNTFIEYTL